jgi:hypothetical protein
MTYHVIKQIPLLGAVKSMVSSQQNAVIWGKIQQVSFKTFPNAPVQKHQGSAYLFQGFYDPIDGQGIRAMFCLENGQNYMGFIEQALADEVFIRIYQTQSEQRETTTLPLVENGSQQQILQEVINKKPLPMSRPLKEIIKEELIHHTSTTDETDEMTLDYDGALHTTMSQVPAIEVNTPAKIANPFQPKSSLQPTEGSTWQQVSVQTLPPTISQSIHQTLSPSLTPVQTLTETEVPSKISEMQVGDEVIHHKYGRCPIIQIQKLKITLNANQHMPVELNSDFFNIILLTAHLPKKVFRLDLK